MSHLERKAKVLPIYQNVGPFNISTFFDANAFRSALAYKPHPGDLFIVGFPKCGTTWMQNIVAGIHRNGKPFSNILEFFHKALFLEFAGAEAAEKMKRPAAFKTHLPYYLTPYSSEAKYIFITRNPKDACISFYYHTKNLPHYNFSKGTFEDYFELYIDGKVDFGNYFDTLLSWYEHRNDPNVLFITYEDLKKNTEANIVKIAEFMGQKYKDALKSDPQLLNDIVYYSSFSYMEKFFNQQLTEMDKMPRDLILNHPDTAEGFRKAFSAKGNVFHHSESEESAQFVRKGVIGDWKNHFSEEQNRRMDAEFYKRTKGTELPNLWKDEMAL